MVARREFSAGVVLVRRMRGRWWFAAVRPRGKPRETWALPKGLIAAGERAVDAALREGEEETGLQAELVTKIGDIRYVYTWQGDRVFKVVSFFLGHAVGGRIGELPAGMEVEIAEAKWLPLADAAQSLAYKGERETAAKALELLGAEAGSAGPDPL